MKAEIGPVKGDAQLAHPRIERVGRNRTRGLRRAFEIDFAVTRKVRNRSDVAFGQDREPALARRETRFRRVEIPALLKRDEIVNRSGVGCEVAGPIDAGEIDPAPEGQRDVLVAKLARRTRRLRLEGRWHLFEGACLHLDLLFLSTLLVDALLQLLQL